MFLDSSVLFSAVFSPAGAARVILRLAEGGVIGLLASSQILAEVEGALRRKAPEILGYLALLLDHAQFEIVANPTQDQITALQSMISYLPDAAVLAAALSARADYLVTLDQRHFLKNRALMCCPPLPIGAPGDFLAWFRHRVDNSPL